MVGIYYLDSKKNSLQQSIYGATRKMSLLNTVEPNTTNNLHDVVNIRTQPYVLP